MKRIYFSPVTETMLMNPASVLCASGGSTTFGVNNSATDGIIID